MLRYLARLCFSYSIQSIARSFLAIDWFWAKGYVVAMDKKMPQKFHAKLLADIQFMVICGLVSAGCQAPYSEFRVVLAYDSSPVELDKLAQSGNEDLLTHIAVNPATSEAAFISLCQNPSEALSLFLLRTTRTPSSVRGKIDIDNITIPGQYSDFPWAIISEYSEAVKELEVRFPELIVVFDATREGETYTAGGFPNGPSLYTEGVAFISVSARLFSVVGKEPVRLIDTLSWSNGPKRESLSMSEIRKIQAGEYLPSPQEVRNSIRRVLLMK